MSVSAPDLAEPNPGQKIIQGVSKRWDTTKSAYLLSQLGNDFSQELHIINPDRKPLKEFITTNFSNELKIISLDTLGIGVHGVVPIKADVTSVSNVLPQPSSSGIRFQPSVWAAYHRAMEESLRRVLFEEDGRVMFQELREIDPKPANMLIEITVDDLVNPLASKEESVEHITESLRKKGFDPLRFAVGKSAPPVERPIMPKSVHSSTSRSLLDELLSILTPAELRQTSMPLVVIAKLKAHPSRQ